MIDFDRECLKVVAWCVYPPINGKPRGLSRHSEDCTCGVCGMKCKCGFCEIERGYKKELSKWKGLCRELLGVAKKIYPEEPTLIKWEEAVNQLQKDKQTIAKVEKELKDE